MIENFLFNLAASASVPLKRPADASIKRFPVFLNKVAEALGFLAGEAHKVAGDRQGFLQAGEKMQKKHHQNERDWLTLSPKGYHKAKQAR